MFEIQFIPLVWVEMAAYAASRGERMVLTSYPKLIERRSHADRRVQPGRHSIPSRRAA